MLALAQILRAVNSEKDLHSSCRRDHRAVLYSLSYDARTREPYLGYLTLVESNIIIRGFLYTKNSVDYPGCDACGSSSSGIWAGRRPPLGSSQAERSVKGDGV